jgi:hypothetical protein
MPPSKQMTDAIRALFSCYLEISELGHGSLDPAFSGHGFPENSAEQNITSPQQVASFQSHASQFLLLSRCVLPFSRILLRIVPLHIHIHIHTYTQTHTHTHQKFWKKLYPTDSLSSLRITTCSVLHSMAFERIGPLSIPWSTL